MQQTHGTTQHHVGMQVSQQTGIHGSIGFAGETTALATLFEAEISYTEGKISKNLSIFAVLDMICIALGKTPPLCRISFLGDL